MVDPANITDFKLNQYQLEERLLFWVCAAGKNGRTAAKCLDKFLKLTRAWFKSQHRACPHSPFKMIREKDNFHRRSDWVAAGMRVCGIGCSTSKSKSFLELAHSGLDIKTCTVEDLESIYGIGPKTARAFLIHSRPNQQYACLDTHILSYMRGLGFDCPKSTPTGNKYKKIENDFIGLAKKANKSIAEFDLILWKMYSGNFDGSKEELLQNLTLTGINKTWQEKLILLNFK